MENKINQKSCENCRYYLAHYIKMNTSYFYTHNGHCININYKDRNKKKMPEVCDFWEDIAIRKKERKKAIKETIEFMCERLNEMAEILKDDTKE